MFQVLEKSGQVLESITPLMVSVCIHVGVGVGGLSQKDFAFQGMRKMEIVI